jgi:hypothetical protein
MIKSTAVVDAVKDQCCSGIAVVTPCDGTKSFLPGGVPNLQFDGFPGQLNHFGTIFNTNGMFVDTLFEGTFNKLMQGTRFTCTSVTNYNELEDVVALCVQGGTKKEKKKIGWWCVWAWEMLSNVVRNGCGFRGWSSKVSKAQTKREKGLVSFT